MKKVFLSALVLAFVFSFIALTPVDASAKSDKSSMNAAAQMMSENKAMKMMGKGGAPGQEIRESVFERINNLFALLEERLDIDLPELSPH